MARIRGTVTGPNGAALAGVVVTITPAAGGGAATNLQTDAQGVYDTGNFPNGNYTVTLQAPPGLQNPAAAQVNAPAGNQPVQQDFALAAVAAPPVNGTITGRITNAAGAGVQNVQVTATLVGGRALPVAASDANGDYTIQNVPPGQYDVAMVAPAGLQNPANQQVQVVAGAAAQANAQLAAAPAPVNGTITGRITNAAGAGVQNVQVTATLVGGAALPVVASDANGDYTIQNVPPGQYDVAMVAPAGLQNPANQQVQVVAGAAAQANAQLAAAAPAPVNGAINGQITDPAGAGVQAVQVTATLVGGAALPAVPSDNAGNYAIANVPPGQYSVAMVPPAQYQAPPAQQVNVAAGPATIVNVQLQAVAAAPVVGSISGLVTAPNAAGANIGFPNALVTVTPAAAGPLPAPGAPPLADAGVPLPSVRTNQQGQYTIANVPAGNYNVSVQAPGQNQNPPIVTIAVAGAAPTVHNVQLPADQVARFINDFIGPNFEIETPVSMLEAGYAASFFRVANVILAGLTENGVGPDLFGSQRVATAANELGIQETAPEWQQTIRDAETLKALVRDLIGAQSLVRLKREAKRQFNLGLENSVTANTRFPVLFRRLVDIASDPILTMDIADQDRNNQNLDKTKIGQADALLRELKDIVVQIVRSLSKEGQAQTRLDTESWVPVADVAMGMALRLSPVRNTGDADDRNPWAVISVLTNKRRDTDVTPFIVLGRHGGRLLELALAIYQEMNRRNALTSFDTGVLRELFQDSRVRNAAPRTFFTDQLREQAAYIKAYPVPNWG